MTRFDQILRSQSTDENKNVKEWFDKLFRISTARPKKDLIRFAPLAKASFGRYEFSRVDLFFQYIEDVNWTELKFYCEPVNLTDDIIEIFAVEDEDETMYLVVVYRPLNVESNSKIIICRELTSPQIMAMVAIMQPNYQFL